MRFLTIIFVAVQLARGDLSRGPSSEDQPATINQPATIKQPSATINQAVQHVQQLHTTGRKRSAVQSVVKRNANCFITSTTFTYTTVEYTIIGAAPTLFKPYTDFYDTPPENFEENRLVKSFFSDYPDATTLPVVHNPSIKWSSSVSKQKSFWAKNKTPLQCTTRTVMQSVCLHDCTSTEYRTATVLAVITAAYRPCGACSIRLKGLCAWSRSNCKFKGPTRPMKTRIRRP